MYATGPYFHSLYRDHVYLPAVLLLRVATY